MNAMTPRRFFIVLSVVAALSVAVSGYFFYQAVANFNGKVTQVGHIKADIQILQDQADLVRSLKANYSSNIEPKLPALNRALPKTKDEITIINALNGLAKRSGGEVSGISFPSAATSSAAVGSTAIGGIQTLPVNFSFSGSYRQLQTFMQGMENFPQECDVLLVDINSAEAGVTAQFNVNMLFKP